MSTTFARARKPCALRVALFGFTEAVELAGGGDGVGDNELAGGNDGRCSDGLPGRRGAEAVGGFKEIATGGSCPRKSDVIARAGIDIQLGLAASTFDADGIGTGRTIDAIDGNDEEGIGGDVKGVGQNRRVGIKVKGADAGVGQIVAAGVVWIQIVQVSGAEGVGAGGVQGDGNAGVGRAIPEGVGVIEVGFAIVARAWIGGGATGGITGASKSIGHGIVGAEHTVNGGVGAKFAEAAAVRASAWPEAQRPALQRAGVALFGVGDVQVPLLIVNAGDGFADQGGEGRGGTE